MSDAKRQSLLLIGTIVAFAALSVLVTLVLVLGERARDAEAVARDAENQIATLQRETRTAENRAKRARAQAGELIGFFTEGLREEMQSIGRTDLLEQAARRAESYFEALPPTDIDADSDYHHAKMLILRAWAHYDQGALAESEAAFARAVELLEKHALADDADPLLVDTLAHIHNESALPLGLAGRWDEAEKKHQLALGLYDSLIAVEPDEPSWRHGRATALFGLAEVARNRAMAPPEAERHEILAVAEQFSEALSAIDAALESQPDDPNYIALKMYCLTNRGQTRIRAEQYDDAQIDAEAATELGERLLVLEPKRKKWRREYATLVNNIGSLLDDRGEHERASAFLEKARGLRKELIAFDPGNANWRSELANSEYNRAINLQLRGDIAAASEAAAQCLSQMQTILRAEPSSRIWQDNLWDYLPRLAEGFDELDSPAEAAKVLESGIAILTELAEKDAAEDRHRLRLAELRYEAGRRRKRAGHFESELAHNLAALELRLALLRADPNDTDRLYELASALGNVGQGYDHNRRREDALRYLQFGYALYQRVPQSYRNRDRYLAMDARDIRLLRTELGLLPPPPKLISEGAEWRFWDRAEAPPEAWNTIEFDDGDWKQGRAQLGYGDGDEETVIDFGGDEFAKHPSAYFRREFEITNGDEITSLHVSLVRDDGAVIYLNGEEVLRELMPEGVIQFDSFAIDFPPTNSENNPIWLDFPDQSPRKLRVGRNVLAVSIHQNEPASSDLSFDLTLLINAPAIDPLEGMDHQALEDLLNLSDEPLP